MRITHSANGGFLYFTEASSMWRLPLFKWRLPLFYGGFLYLLEASSIFWRLPLFSGGCLYLLEAWSFTKKKFAPRILGSIFLTLTWLWLMWICILPQENKQSRNQKHSYKFIFFDIFKFTDNGTYLLWSLANSSSIQRSVAYHKFGTCPKSAGSWPWLTYAEFDTGSYWITMSYLTLESNQNCWTM